MNVIEAKKFGQITKVYVNGKHVRDTGLTVKATLDLLRLTMAELHIENVEFREGE